MDHVLVDHESRTRHLGYLGLHEVDQRADQNYVVSARGFPLPVGWCLG